MELYINKYRKFQILFITGFLFICILIFSSCRDENILVENLKPGISCDTNGITFTKFVQPTLDRNCLSCHNNSYAMAGINLEGYDNIKSSAITGMLMKSFSGKMGNYMNNNCEISKIQAWINQGSLNN